MRKLALWRATITAAGLASLCLPACSSAPSGESQGSSSSTGDETELSIELEFEPAAHVLGGTLHVATNRPMRLVSTTIVGLESSRPVPASGLTVEQIGLMLGGAHDLEPVQ
ncbi:MAG: hypothetical protein ACPG77_17220 [Nannocystaceae bacterium]